HESCNGLKRGIINSTQEIENHLGEEKDGERKDNRNYSCLVYSKRNVSRNTPVHTRATHSLGIRNRNWPFRLGNNYHSKDNGKRRYTKCEIERNLCRIKCEVELACD